MDKKIEIDLKKSCILAILLYFILAVIFNYVAGEQLHYRASNGNISSIQGNTSTYEITNHFMVKQEFICKSDEIEYISLQFATFGRINTGSITIRLKDESNNILMEKNLDVSTLKDVGVVKIYSDNPIKGLLDKKLAIEIRSETGEDGNAIAPWYSKNIRVENQQLYMNDEPADGTLCFSTYGRDYIEYSQYYWAYVTIIGIILCIYSLNLIYKQKKGKRSGLLNAISAFIKYRFLISQLVERDFKTKYKRSVLGVLWSFLNPLLTMAVQYIVFSTIFKSDIDNYPVYLLSGIILFNFFTEAIGMSLMSIVGNASLITKVYVPKYIYPITRVLSSAVNLLIAMVPLMIVIIFTEAQITKAMLLIPFVIICLITFCIGLGFLMSAAMVYFRDTQFLWGVISLLWMYATPLFYPETIIPAQIMTVYKMNPMYHFIRFFRIVILYGVSPEPIVYLQCLIFAIGMLIIGGLIFKKAQDKFVLYI